MRSSSLLAALAAILVLAGCGAGASSPHTVRHPPPAQPAGTQLPPGSCQSTAPPCTAIVPEGARGAEESRYIEGTPPLTLTGGAIQLDTFGAKLTGSFENVSLARYCPYWDPYGHVWSRGYGETDWSGNFGGRCISKAEALRNLIYLMNTRYLGPVRALGVNFSHTQVDALGDLSWNLGPGVICCYLAGLLRAHAWASAASYIRRYSYAGGQFLSGLYARRVREGALLLHAEPTETPAQRRARRRRALARDQAELISVRHRKRALEHALVRSHCKPRSRRRACARWVSEAHQAHLQGVRLDGEVRRLRRELR